jgi:hypothetical protein
MLVVLEGRERIAKGEMFDEITELHEFVQMGGLRKIGVRSQRQRLCIRVVRSQEDNDRNLFLTPSVIDLAMQIIESKRHGTPKDTTGETQGQCGQRH